jgi:hypothetical protein
MSMPASSKPTPRGKRSSGWWFEFEHRKLPLLPWPAFARRMLVSLLLGIVFVGGSLALGMVGYHFYEGLGLVDSFLNAAMILSGMGPVDTMQSDAGKVFAGAYALYSGLAVLVTAGLLFAPLIHRLLHRFHADDSDDSSK